MKQRKYLFHSQAQEKQKLHKQKKDATCMFNAEP
jgi:hypothetical protein